MADQQPTDAQPVIVEKSAPNTQVVGEEKEWNHGLFGCFETPGLACMTCLLPCVTYGQIAEQEGQGTCTKNGLIFCLSAYVGVACIFEFFQRGNIRKKRNIKGDDASDFLVSCCCVCCSLVQAQREIEESPLNQ